MTRTRSTPWLLALLVAMLAPAQASTEETALAPSDLDRCIGERGLTRIARVVDPDGRVVYARVVDDRDGVPMRVVRVAAAGTSLREVFERAKSTGDAEPFAIPHDQLGARVCSPVDLPQRQLDDESRVIVAAGLNYAAHAEEAGGGDVFVFPKPSAPTGPYTRVHPPADALLDYEIELAFVLLSDVDPSNPPAMPKLLEDTAFFLSNDVSDRAAIVRNAEIGGPGTGFVRAKGQPGFFPAGPWMIRGSELFPAIEACGAEGIGLRLWVDEGKGPGERQSASTALMILDPRELIVRIGDQIEREGIRTRMPGPSADDSRFYPFAVDGERPLLPAGSVLLTGTPAGVAMSAPGIAGLTLRALANFRGPVAQFLAEENERAQEGGSYLMTGDRVIARIDGLGTQSFTIGAADAEPPPDPCRGAPEVAP